MAAVNRRRAGHRDLEPGRADLGCEIERLLERRRLDGIGEQAELDHPAPWSAPTTVARRR
jgi:hypothetical protein